MKRIYYLLFAGVLAIVASCHKPQFVEPTAERQGITSLTAFFTDGPYVDQELAKYVITEPELTRYVIPVPWFFPEESDNQTTLDMSRVRVRAELAENCKIDPPLTILDLYEENEFTYTNAQGESRQIIITGERVKASTTKLLTFNLLDSEGKVSLEGFVNNDTKEIYLFSIDDLSGLKAEAEPWYHASMKDAGVPDNGSTFWSIEAKNWNEEQTVTVIAHDGKTEGIYKTLKREPQKIDYGFNHESLKPLFSIDPYTRIGTPPYTEKVYSTLAYVGGYLVIGHGPNHTPIYVDGRNGSKLGEIATGGKTFGALTSDEAGNMILCNHLDTQGTFELYKTTSVTVAPELFYQYESEVALPLGAKIKVNGDINRNARITVAYEGVSGVTSASQFLEITVVGGNVTKAEVLSLASAGLDWGPAPGNTAGLVPISSEAGVDGWFTAKYSEPFNGICWVKPDLSLGTPAPGLNTNYNPTWMDCKHYNNANYMVLVAGSYFPGWGDPYIYLYDMGDPSSVKSSFTSNSALITSEKLSSNVSDQPDSGLSSGDVLIAPSADGFKVFVYYYDHYVGIIGGFSADCVKK